MRNVRWLFLPLSALVAWGCGSTDQPSPPPSVTLAVQADNVRLAATLREIKSAEEELRQLRILVERLEAAGQISPERADRILAAADEVREQLVLLDEGDDAISPSGTPSAPEPDDGELEDQGEEEELDEEAQKEQEKEQKKLEKEQEKLEKEVGEDGEEEEDED